MKNFALTGVAGYIAPRHLQAIKDTGNTLIAATDPHDSVGILDRYFPDACYFREFERFDRHLEKLRRGPADQRIRYLSVCSPNYLHDAHIRLALRIGADAICEKPLVLNPWNLDALQELEQETGRRVYTVLQLRLHPAILAMREQFSGKRPGGGKYEIDLRYITSRGPWYLFSWKGRVDESGGLATNIGIHFFDMLMWIFGRCEDMNVAYASPTRTEGTLELERARVRWSLSIDRSDLPEAVLAAGKSTFRSMTVDGTEAEFSEGFTDLHTLVYKDILAGGGFGIDDARAAIELAHAIRDATTHEG